MIARAAAISGLIIHDKAALLDHVTSDSSGSSSIAFIPDWSFRQPILKQTQCTAAICKR